MESSIGHRRRRFPYAFSGIGGAEFSKKCDLIPSEHKWNVIGYKVALARSAEYLTLKSKIRPKPTERSGVFAKCVRNSMRPDALLLRAQAAWKSQHQKCAF